MNKLYLPAQWEEQEFVQLTFPHKQTDWIEYFDDAIITFINIAKAIQKYQKVLIIAQELNYVKSLFKNKNNITFVKINSNDTWSRDFGGITVKQNDVLTVLDFKFNAWGKKYPSLLDNQITTRLKLKGLLKEYKHKSIDFVLEGGSIDSNGAGIIMTTSRCLLHKKRNPFLNKNSIEQQLIFSLGAQKVLWLESGALEGDDTDSHIDTLARFVNEDTIVYQSCTNINDSNYNELKNMENELKNFTDLKGNKFNLISLPNIDAIYENEDKLPATYVNFLIINNAVLVPIYNQKSDLLALNIFKTLFKKREIIPIDCTTLIKQHGSLHCVTMNYPKI